MTATATGEMAVMDRTGDTKTIWDKDNADEVAAAKATFTALKKKGYIAYRVNADGNKGTVLGEFDPTAEKIIMSPALAGG